jgi:hypothetical protein
MQSEPMDKLLRFDRSRRRIPEPDGRLAIQPADADGGISKAFMLRLSIATLATFATILLILHNV